LSTAKFVPMGLQWCAVAYDHGMAYTIQRQARRLGPYGIGQVRVLAQSGEVSGADLVWREGSPIPTTVAQLLQAAEHATAASAPPATGEPDRVSTESARVSATAAAPAGGSMSTSEPAGSSPPEPESLQAPEPDVDLAFTSPPSSEAVFKKGAAMTSLWLAALGLIPVLGLFCAVPAIFSGLKGLNETKDQPQSRERMHALVGVLVGGFLTLMYLFLIAFFVMKAGKE
jgi:hypothetical protein